MSDFTADDRVRAQFWTPVGQPGSGRLRYAAAMHFYQSGRLSADALEIYRICSPKDSEDPVAVMRGRKMVVDLPGPAAAAGELAIRLLVEEADRYLGLLDGPGIAEVRAGIATWGGGEVTVASGGPNPTVARWMPAALDALHATHPALADAIALAVPYLDWHTFDGYPIDEVGAAFAQGHAFCSIFGEDASIAASDWDMGLFLIPPHVLYRDRCHPAPELYAPLTGPHGWRFGPDRPLALLPAHQPVWNDPMVPHLTKVGPVPFLSLFCWTRDVNAAAEILPAGDWPALEDLRIEA